MARNHLSTSPLRLMLSLCAVMLLAACGTSSSPWEKDIAARKPPEPTRPNAKPVKPSNTRHKVALLVPMSGRGSDAGQSIMNAAQLAMFDLGGDAFELMPRDTGASVADARKAAADSIADGAELILGPLFAEDAKAVAPVAAKSGINVISFSTDTTAAGGNTFILGFLPQGQVRRIVEYSGNKGLNRIALIAPRDAFGDAVARDFETVLKQRSLTGAGILRYAGVAPSPAEMAAFTSQNSFSAVLVAANAQQSSAIAQALKSAVPSSQILGTGLWDQADARTYPGLAGAWYAASSPKMRQSFEGKYKQTYGETPPRLASLGYDAAALAVVLARQGSGYDQAALLNPNGFAGIDGIFRFHPNGENERGLSVLQIGQGAPRVIENAPGSFR